MAGSHDNESAAHDGTTRQARIIVVAGQSSRRTQEVLDTLRGFTNVIWPPSLAAALAQTGSGNVACLEIADDLQCPIVNSELSGDPNDPVRSEHAFYRSMSELAPIFEKYGIGLNLEAHPYDFAELNDDAIGIIRGLNLPWVNYVFCAPTRFTSRMGRATSGE